MTIVQDKIRILVVGCGNMGASHAAAYHAMEEFAICGLVSTGNSKYHLNEKLTADYPLFSDYKLALEITKPDAVCISTYPDTHESYAITAFESGCHVFIEKPLADTVIGAHRVVEAALRSGKKLVVGYILRYHPSWIRFIEMSKELGTPLVMRMNLNQQSYGELWQTHLNLMKTLSPIVDCGVHYIDVMCQMVNAKPQKVHAMGVRLTDQISVDNYNYGQLQLHFEDGSIGWYEAGWGPMVSETAFFIKDVIGPKGSVSIIANKATSEGKSADIDMHTKTESLRFHSGKLNAQGQFEREDQWVNLSDEPDHQELCNREQQFFLKAIKEDIDLSESIQNAVDSLRIAFACDESIRTGEIVRLDQRSTAS